MNPMGSIPPSNPYPYPYLGQQWGGAPVAPWGYYPNPYYAAAPQPQPVYTQPAPLPVARPTQAVAKQPSPVQSAPRFIQPIPVSVTPATVATPQKEASHNAFRWIKVILSGIGGGIAGSEIFRISKPFAIVLEMGIGLTEALLTEKMASSKSPWMNKLLEKTHSLLGGAHHKKGTSLTDKEREECITPLSALITGLSGFITATISYFKSKSEHVVETSREALMREFNLETASIWKKAYKGLSVLSHDFSQSAPMQFLRKYPALLILTTTLGSMIMGLIEGWVGNKLGSHSKA